MRAIRTGLAGLLCASVLGGCGGKSVSHGPDLGAGEMSSGEVADRDRGSSDTPPVAVSGTTGSAPMPRPTNPGQGGSPDNGGLPNGDAGEPDNGGGDGGAGSEFPPNSRYGVVPADATGTVLFLPELGVLELAQVAELVQSTYFKTTPENREFRRGVMEFQIPELPGRAILSAKLALISVDSSSSDPFPPEAHRLYAYEGDGVVTPEDYDATGVQLGVVMTDENDQVKPRLEIDITQHIETFRGRRMTVRVQPDLPSDYAAYDSTAFRGAEFWLHEVVLVDVWIPP